MTQFFPKKLQGQKVTRVLQVEVARVVSVIQARQSPLLGTAWPTPCKRQWDVPKARLCLSPVSLLRCAGTPSTETVIPRKLIFDIMLPY